MIGPAALVAVLLSMADGGARDAQAVDAGAPDDAAVRSSTDAGPPDAAAAPVPVVPAPVPTGRVVGRLLAKGTQAPVVGAAITSDATPLGDTNARGEFDVALPCGLRRLTVLAAGFEPLAADVEVCGRAPAPLTWRLTPDGAHARHETVVRAKPVHATVRLTKEELTQTAGTMGDPLRALESLPGVATVAWPAPIYAVRGSNPGNTGFFLDSIRIPALFHLALGPSVIHPYFFESLQFFPGGYPAQFGRYVAGIVAADTRAAATDRVHSSVDVRLFDAGAMVSAPLPGNGGVAVAARYSYTGELVSLLAQDIRLAYWDYQLRVDRRVGPVQLTLLAFGSHDVLAPGTSSGTPSRNEVDIDFKRVSLRASVPVAGGRLQGSVAVGSDRTRAPILDVYPITVATITTAPRLAYLRSFAAADVAVGFDGDITRYEPLVLGTVQAQDTSDLARRRWATLLAGYLSATLRPHRRVEVTPELRLDTYDVAGAHAQDLGPRLAARVGVREDTAIRVAGGRFTQLPSLPLQIPGADGFGLSMLGLQSSWQGSVGVETSHFFGLELTATGYYQRYRLTDMRDPAPSRPDPLANDFLINRDAVSYGLELLVRRPATQRLYGWLSYTLSNNLRSYGGGAVGPSDWDQRHILNLVLGYRWGRTTLGGRVHYNTGRPYVLYDGSATVPQTLVERLPPFYQVDLRIDRHVYYDKFQLDLYAELVNATLTPQVYALEAILDDRVSQKSFRLVLPSIGVRAEF
ncbi:MAG: TonB-dependent receptor plug domain-containing protein [Polyangia bacterium]